MSWTNFIIDQGAGTNGPTAKMNIHYRAQEESFSGRPKLLSNLNQQPQQPLLNFTSNNNCNNKINCG
jgi:hypothetical protein